MIELAVGGILSLTWATAGALLGYRLGRRKRDRGAICPCGHGINFHDAMAGRCRYTWRTGGFLSAATDWKCDCRHYAGPELLSASTLYREITDRGVTDQQ